MKPYTPPRVRQMPIPKKVSVEEQFLADESGSWDEEVSILDEKNDEEHSPAEEFERSSRQSNIPKQRRKPYVHPERIPRHIPIQSWTGDPQTRLLFINQLSVYAYFNHYVFDDDVEKMLWACSFMTGLAADVVSDTVRCTVSPDIPQKLGRGFGPEGECRTWKQFLNNFLPTVSERARLKAKAIEGKKQSRRFGRIAHYIPQWDANVLALYNAVVFAVFLKLLDIAAENFGMVWAAGTSSLRWIAAKVQG